MKLMTLQQASTHTRLSVPELQLRIQSGTLPAHVSNNGKILLDIDAVMIKLRSENLGNNNNADLLIAFDDLDEKEKPPSMANIHMQWGGVNQDDVDSGRFAPDTFALRTLDEPTSETLRVDKAPKKP